MSRVRGAGNRSTELRLIRLFREYKITGWRRNYKLFGKPDFVFPKMHVAVFVDGEFWHGHPRFGSIPKTNSEFWKQKIERNKRRDRVVNRTLRENGWVVVRIWAHELKGHAWRRKIAKAIQIAETRTK